MAPRYETGANSTACDCCDFAQLERSVLSAVPAEDEKEEIFLGLHYGFRTPMVLLFAQTSYGVILGASSALFFE
jgi:hypothetical protein